eukprot:CAMPEP_0174890760 /NCGR_PEP_ID=MMETSP0167-20121228/5857_1 /TAXON_ID=38298 /ORGANISM="Rhodella maculata, Strain CCMP736" /LENGTH=91 /DNA_ID=CAMNT_0016128673 /DNA_START=61 /DNA_END=337 /DNA_ORIENTATION=-
MRSARQVCQGATSRDKSLARVSPPAGGVRPLTCTPCSLPPEREAHAEGDAAGERQREKVEEARVLLEAAQQVHAEEPDDEPRGVERQHRDA